jgi:NAD(P)-dependent dehydrogenase (short-subunit alcohol dehydrogenase family)
MSSYLVTGASRGLGLELAAQLLSRPESSVKRIFATTRSEPPEALQKLIAGSSGRLVNIVFDPLDLNSIQATVPVVKKHLDGAGLDVIINNVGAMPYTPDGIKTM